ncbi:hypothetical protein G6F59_018653 [Rhizopus arrhizus]|nr:hypothetical protein G6F59_018653 [Rhizopus arrhizus]
MALKRCPSNEKSHRSPGRAGRRRHRRLVRLAPRPDGARRHVHHAGRQDLFDAGPARQGRAGQVLGNQLCDLREADAGNHCRL